MRRALWTLLSCCIVPLSFSGARASKPVPKTTTACVIDGLLISTDGFVLTPVTDGTRPFNPSVYSGMEIEVDGQQLPGDAFFIESEVRVHGPCPAAQKLKLVPALVRTYQAQADVQSGDLPQPQTGPVIAARTLPLDCAETAGEPCYQLVRVPKVGGVPKVLRSAPPGREIGGSILVDDKYVYWGEGPGRDRQLMRMDKATGATSVIGSARGEVVRAAGSFYSLADDKLLVQPDGRPARLLATKTVGYGLLGLASSATDIYWTESGPANAGFVWTQPHAGGKARLLSVGQRIADGLTVQGNELFFYTSGATPAGNSQIWSIPVGGGVPTPLVETPFPWTLAADERSLYWVEWRKDARYELYRAPVRGGARVLLGAAGEDAGTGSHRDHVELDGTHAYWSARRTLARVPKPGGRTEELVRLARGSIQRFVMDDRDLYLTAVFY